MVSTEGMTLAEARLESARLRSLFNQGIDPAAKKKHTRLISLKTLNDVAQDWLSECCKRLENPQIPARAYRKDTFPAIGEFSIDCVTALEPQQSLHAKCKTLRYSVASQYTIVFTMESSQATRKIRVNTITL